MVPQHEKGQMIMEVCGASFRNSATAYTRRQAERCLLPPIGKDNHWWNTEGMPDLMPRMRPSTSHLVIHLLMLQIALHLMSLCRRGNSNHTTGDRRRSRCKRWHLEFATANLLPESDIECGASRSRRALRTDKVSFLMRVCCFVFSLSPLWLTYGGRNLSNRLHLIYEHSGCSVLPSLVGA